MVVGVAVRYLAGEVNERPDATAHRRPNSRHRGLDIVRLVRALRPRRRRAPRIPRPGRATASSCWSTCSTATWSRSARSTASTGCIRLRAELARPPLLSLERLAERRSLLAYAMMSAQAPIPRLVAGIPVGADAIVLAYEYVDGVPIDQLPDGLDHDQLIELWKTVQHPARAPDHPPRADRRRDPARARRAARCCRSRSWAARSPPTCG